MPFVEINTPIRGLVQLLVGLASINLVDCRDEALKTELFRRCNDRASIEYRRDEGPDSWTAFSLLAERAGDGVIKADCEDLAALWAAFLLLSGFRVKVCISQPRPKAMAHAYCRVWDETATAWRVWDPSVYHGMNDPGADFYGRGEGYCCELTPPC